KSNALGNEKRKIHSGERVGVWGVHWGKDKFNDAKHVYPCVAVRGIGLVQWGWGGGERYAGCQVRRLGVLGSQRLLAAI
ncbi:MAG: hypothetical protein ACOYNO_03710, partial [Saprospiraceae bacterium]